MEVSRLGGRQHRRHLPLVLVAAAVAAVLLASCSSGGPVAGPGGSSQRPAPGPAASATKPVQPTTTSSLPPTTTTFAPEEPGWQTLSTGPRGIAVDERTFPQPDGSQVTVARFLFGRVDYSLHVGSQDPPAGTAVIGPNSGPAVSGAERPLLLACFNGGFKANTGSGGVEVGGQVLTPLSDGLASLVIDSAGDALVGVWGQDVPPPGLTVVSVRQNLAPLVEGGVPSPQVGNISAWGATLGGGAAVARSALGQDPQGDLLYAASMSAVPADLASALVSAGATVAMQLDINPYWVQLATAATPGGTLVAQVPGQNRPADQCQVGWTRDFVAVLSVG
ncbi:MAG TPA: hypothetical protein VMU76_06265 [Acidimicrobiales bacterium]|nr:hypothetical protein [Acidimicrobiales bacterium]